VGQKKLKTQRSRSNETAAARGHHGRPVVFTTDRGEGRTVVLPGSTAMRLPGTQVSSFCYAAVHFPWVFQFELLFWL